MPLAEVKTIYKSNCLQIAETMRNNADAIESGDFGESEALVMVLLTALDGRQEIDVFGLGDTNYWQSLGILHGGIQKLARMLP